MTVKRQVEIEVLIRWAYQDELPKRATSSAEGIWDRLAQNGSLGGIDPDPGHGAAQRYAHFGLPHPDAEAIERAVSALEDATIDWAAEGETIMGPAIGLVDPRPKTARDTTIGYRDRHRDKIGWRTETVAPARDVIMVRSLRTANLVIMHAAKGTRPEWGEERPRPYPVKARGRPKMIGECRGKGLYTEGSHCPISWEPSPIAMAQERADYLAWWRGLAQLASTLELAAHTVLPPAAPEFPWNEPAAGRAQPPRIFKVGTETRVPLPLKPDRSRHSSVTMSNADA